MCKLANKVAQAQAAFAPTAPLPVAGCPYASQEAAKKTEALPWELRVRIKSLDASRQPQNVTVLIETLEGGSGTKTITPQTAEFLAEEGTGARKFKVSASADKWELVAAREETLNDGDNKTVEVELRPKPWKLKVRVTSQNGVPADEVSVSLNVLEGGAGAESRTLKMVNQTEEFPLEGNGRRKYEISASVPHYELVAKQEVTLEDGDDKPVTVELRPLPWVEFYVVEKVDGKEQAVENVTFKLALPGDRQEEPVSTGEKIRYSVKQGMCKIEEMSHAEFWEVEEVS